MSCWMLEEQKSVCPALWGMQNETCCGLYFPPAGCQDKSSSGQPPGHGHREGITPHLLTSMHSHMGTTLSSLPWHKMGKVAKIQSVKSTAFPPWAHKEMLYMVCLLLSQFPDKNRFPSPVACSEALTPGKVAGSSDRCKIGIVCLTPGFLS